MSTKIVFFILFISVNFRVFSQSDSIKLSQIKYTPALKFTDGIYLNFNQFRNNSPLPKSKIVTQIKTNDFDFFDKLLNENSLRYFDEMGVQQQIKENKIWGYCDKGVPYILFNDEFNRIPIIGSICHFVANKTYIDQNYTPYGHTDYYDPAVTRTEMRQYLLNTETGEILDYTVDAVEVILMKDPKLYDEFNAMKRSKKKKNTFLYIRKYNEAHPLFIPLTK
jgi:hypothetical protein